MDYHQINFEKSGQVALVTLNRPERRNAWTWRMKDELVDAITRSNEDPDVGAIIMTGAGKGFCAGADMEDTLKSDIESEGKRLAENKTGSWAELVRQSKPLIAAVNGAAVGIGLTQILPFDIIIASDQARFGMFFIRLGLVPELCSTYFLVARMGFGRANEMVLSGRLYDAQEAYEKGLADRLVPNERLLPEAFRVAEEIAANPTLQLQMIKQLITLNGSESDLRLVEQREQEFFKIASKSPEHKEAVDAFLEKRPPKYTRG
jgi:enoyl-CoA hydratase/carnithine racemase